MRQRTLTLAVFGSTLGAAAWWGAGHLGDVRFSVRGWPSRTSAAAPDSISEAERHTRDIDFYEQRARRDPESAADRAQLAGLYLQRARETGNYEDFQRAEEVARASLTLRISHNTGTYVTLASSLLAQHRFIEARDVARDLVKTAPDLPSYRALLGEVELELGNYDAARATFRSLANAHGHLAVAPRLARWAEITGRPDVARWLLRRARDEAVRRSDDLPQEQLAWFHLRLGDFELRNGRLNAAARALRAGLEVSPNDYRLLGAMARLEAVRHRWKNAIEYGERAMAVTLEPAVLGVVGDAYAAVGDSARAYDYYRVMEVSLLSQSGPFHRAWSLFLLDHDRRMPQVVAKVEAELQTRRDTYGYDLLAWARYKQGRHAEAQQAMAAALAQGTQDALLFYHAGMIERAMGHRAAARRYLERALAANPYFDPTHPAAARATLDSLRREEAQ